MKLLPVALNVSDRRCLLVGGGAVSLRKARALLECGAVVTVIAPQLHEGFLDLQEAVEHQPRDFQSGDCAGFALIFACTDDPKVNAAVAAEARKSGIWCNLVDDPQVSDFHTAATLRRGEIAIGISTGSVSPLLARHLKQQIAPVVGKEYGLLVDIVKEQAGNAGPFDRGVLWRALLEGDALMLLRSGRHDEAAERVAAALEAALIK